MSASKMAGFMALIQGIDSKLNRNNYDKLVDGNSTLALIFNYNSCNEYGKAIMEYSKLPFNYTSDCEQWHNEYPNFDVFEDEDIKIEASKKLLKIFRLSAKDYNRYYFIFWALMILAVDKKDAEEHLSMICDFSFSLSIQKSEFEDIIQMVKIIFAQDSPRYRFKSTSTIIAFKGVLEMLGGSE